MIRDVARSRFEWAGRVAGELDATHIVLHHGYVPGTSMPSRWLARCRRFWMDFLATQSPGVQFHLENMLEHDPELLADVVAAINHPQVDVCLDVGHVHCHSTLSLVRWIERLGRQIGDVHLHDNHGTDDEHLGLGDGTIPLGEVCQALEAYAPQALWTIEAQPASLESSLRWLQQQGLMATPQG
jgi:sugar phosphate isomerase/epimerase